MGVDVDFQLAGFVVGLAIGATGVWLNFRSERDRRQPIVVAHGDGARRLSDDATYWYALAHITK